MVSYEHLFAVEYTSNALADNRLILVGSSTAGRDLGKNVVGSEHTSRPASPAKVNVRVGHQVVEDVADGSQAGLVVGAAGLGEDGLTAVGAEPRGELGEAGDVGGGGNASRVGAAVVRVRVLVDVENEVGLAAVEVGDLVEGSSRAIVDKVSSVSLGFVSMERDSLRWYVRVLKPDNLDHVFGGPEQTSATQEFHLPSRYQAAESSSRWHRPCG